MTEYDRIKDDEIDAADLKSALGGYWANGRWHSGDVRAEAVTRLGSTPDAWTVLEPQPTELCID